jgi:two-component system sensor histidine kinase DesK
VAIELTEDARLSLPRELVVGRVVMIAFASVLISRELGLHPDTSSSEMPVLLALVTTFSAAWVWFWWRLAASANVLGTATALLLVVTTATAMVALNPIGIFPFYYAVIVAGASYPWRLGAALVATTCALGAVTWSTVAGSDDVWEALLVMALFGGAAISVRRYVAAHLALTQSQDALRQLATSEARAELARDLHDRLGQQLAVGVLQAELLVEDLEDASPAVQQRAALLLGSSRDALQLMRETVTDSWTPTLTSELAAAKTLLAAVGVSCSQDVRCSSGSTRADSVLGWVVREGVTNVLRHSGAHRCEILLERHDDDLVLTINDDGRGLNTGAHAGSGLASMEHRLSSVGGRLDVISRVPKGFQLVATVPVYA